MPATVCQPRREPRRVEASSYTRGIAEAEVLPLSTRSQRALGMIRSLILDGSFEPGEKLSEPKLCASLGISRTPVSTALRQLEFEGLLDPAAHGGFRVRSFSIADVQDTVMARASMEALAVRLAIGRGIDSKLVVQAHELLMRMDSALNTRRLDATGVNFYAESNRQFHSLLVQMSGSEVLQRHLDRAAGMNFGDPNAFVQARLGMPEAHTAFVIAHEHHKQIIQAISRRDTARSDALLVEHGRAGCRAMAHAIRTGRADLIAGGSLISRRPL